MDSYTVIPVGMVRSPVRAVADDCWGGTVSEIVLDESRFAPEALLGLEEYSHVVVVFLLHNIGPESVLTGSKHPRERSDWPRVGVFAQRTKNRPNRIAVTTCEIVRIEGAGILVKELDAINGTPVLDLKPYMEEFGPRSPVRQPRWSRELMREYFRST